jgi:hypothetical protein
MLAVRRFLVRAVRLLVLLTLVVDVRVSAAEEHLVPDDLIDPRAADEYGQIVSGVFGKVLRQGTYVVVIPNFSPEFAVAINGATPTCTVSYLWPTHRPWYYVLQGDDADLREIQAKLPSDPMDVSVKSKSATIRKRGLCERLRDVWLRALLTTQSPVPTQPETIILDGTSYHFTTWRTWAKSTGKRIARMTGRCRVNSLSWCTTYAATRTKRALLHCVPLKPQSPNWRRSFEL